MKKKKKRKIKITTIADFIRQSKEYKDWRKRQVVAFENKCWITGKKSKYLHVHHAISSFHEILLSVTKQMNITYNSSIHEIPKPILNRVIRLFWLKHNEVKGIPLLKKVHNEFHKQYGFIDTTLDQLKMFKMDYLSRKNKKE